MQNIYYVSLIFYIIFYYIAENIYEVDEFGNRCKVKTLLYWLFLPIMAIPILNIVVPICGILSIIYYVSTNNLIIDNKILKLLKRLFK